MFFQGIAVPIQDQLARFAPATDLGAFISNIVGFALILASLAAFVWLVWGGIEWIMSGGDKAKVESARDRITNAIIGLAIVAAAWAIFLILNHFFGLGIAGGTSNTSSAPTGGGSSYTAPAAGGGGGDSSACASSCASQKPGCTGTGGHFDKNEFGIPGCQCEPPGGYKWVSSGSNPFDHCEPI